MKPSEDLERMTTAIENAEMVFWDTITAAYPEVKTGDFPIDAALDFSTAMEAAITTWLKANEAEAEEEKCRTTEILLHRIEYRYDNGMELTDGDEEHIAYWITQGVSDGELSTLVPVTNEKFDRSVRGYWKINNK